MVSGNYERNDACHARFRQQEAQQLLLPSTSNPTWRGRINAVAAATSPTTHAHTRDAPRNRGIPSYVMCVEASAPNNPCTRYPPTDEPYEVVSSCPNDSQTKSPINKQKHKHKRNATRHTFRVATRISPFSCCLPAYVAKRVTQEGERETCPLSSLARRPPHRLNQLQITIIPYSRRGGAATE